MSMFIPDSDSEDQDSEIDNPCLTPADERRRQNKKKSKAKPKLTKEEIDAIMEKDRQNKLEREKKKKAKQEKHI